MTQPTTDSPLLIFVLTALTAMMAPSMTDRALAQRAAREAVETYQARGEADWLAIGQIVAFGVSIIDTLRLAMQPDTSPPLKLKLQTTANASSRAAQTIANRITAAPRPAKAAQPEPPPPPIVTDQDWATGMLQEAARLQAEAATTPPDQRKTNALWIDVLTEVAKELGTPPAPQSTGKGALLRSTSMAGNPYGHQDNAATAELLSRRSPPYRHPRT